MYSQNCIHLNSAATNIPLSSINERPTCLDCGCHGPNLWICLFNNCFHIGCSEKSNDHSTLHHAANSTHCIHMNLWTKRIWCYECKNEVFLEITSYNNESDHDVDVNDMKPSKNHQLSSSPDNGSVYGFEKNIGLNVGMSGDVTESSDDDDCSAISDKPVGLVGLQNIGNTCYMNAALQALSNAVPLARFFLECPTTVQMLSEGKKPGLSRTFQTLMNDIWLKKNGGYVSPSGILYGIRNVYPMFRGYYQHDTQEFLRNFMDQLHEELKQIAPPELAHLIDSESFSLAMDEPGVSSNYDSSEGEYETCDSGVSERSSLSDDTERSTTSSKRRLSRSTSPVRRLRSRLHSLSVIDSQPSLSSTTSSSTSTNKKQTKYRSIISDIFDGKLLSSVQCLTCDRVSSRIETFQDLSLPIPSRDHLLLLHGRTNTPGSTCSKAVIPANDGWMSWILAWIKSWFYGPTVTLHDCLAAFFSTDELKGDNMYSCEKCNKLRNGIKFSKVLQLPEILCIHLKRFRHELMFSSKIASFVSFPLRGLDMRPYLHTECISRVTNYELFSIICHYGTAGGGHYICYALNGGQWYEFDDQYVTRVTCEKVQSCEAYVLFYRKVTNDADQIREETAKLAKLTGNELHQVTYLSKQWLNRFYTCAEPGPIDNSDFLCQHGSVNPDVELYFEQITIPLPLNIYEYLYKSFGGCPPLTSMTVCAICEAFNKRLLHEMEAFLQLSKDAQNQAICRSHLISISWYTQWQKFVQRHTPESPGPIDNTKINVNHIDVNECVEITEAIWNFFYTIYGGGPELRVKQQRSSQRTESESSVQSDDDDVPTFVTPLLKKTEKTDTIDKNLYCAGEPMEINEGEDGATDDKESYGLLLETKESQDNTSNIVTCSSDDCNVEILNSKRYRRRRKALSNL